MGQFMSKKRVSSNTFGLSGDVEGPDRKKRRLGVIESDETTRTATGVSNEPAFLTGTPLLPPELWSFVITDHLSYQDVMGFAATCHSFLHEVLPLMPRLFFEHPQELHMSQAKRFSKGNVKEIRIYSYIKQERVTMDEVEETDRVYYQKVCGETACRVLPFVLAFPKLQFLFLGGVQPLERLKLGNYPEEKLEDKAPGLIYGNGSTEDIYRNGEIADSRLEYQKYCDTTEDELDVLGYGVLSEQQHIHAGVARAFGGAYQSGDLSSDLHIHGLIGCFGCQHGESECNGLCGSVSKSFPLKHVWRLIDGYSDQLGTCIGIEQRLQIISQRSDGQAFLKSSEHFVYLIALTTSFATQFAVDFQHPNPESVASYIATMRKLRDDFGCDPSKLPWDKLRECLPEPQVRITREAVDGLLSIGFCIPRDYFKNVGDLYFY